MPRECVVKSLNSPPRASTRARVRVVVAVVNRNARAPCVRRPRECDSNAARESESDSHARPYRARARLAWGSGARGNMREKTLRAFGDRRAHPSSSSSRVRARRRRVEDSRRRSAPRGHPDASIARSIDIDIPHR
jgi:hypothetical protein